MSLPIFTSQNQFCAAYGELLEVARKNGWTTPTESAQAPDRERILARNPDGTPYYPDAQAPDAAGKAKRCETCASLDAGCSGADKVCADYWDIQSAFPKPSESGQGEADDVLNAALGYFARLSISSEIIQIDGVEYYGIIIADRLTKLLAARRPKSAELVSVDIAHTALENLKARAEKAEGEAKALREHIASYAKEWRSGSPIRWRLEAILDSIPALRKDDAAKGEG
jgi:hypothetical protein